MMPGLKGFKSLTQSRRFLYRAEETSTGVENHSFLVPRPARPLIPSKNLSTKTSLVICCAR